MADDFFRTGMGRTFYDGTMPRIATALHGIWQEFKRFNDRAATPELTGRMVEVVRNAFSRGYFDDHPDDSEMEADEKAEARRVAKELD